MNSVSSRSGLGGLYFACFFGVMAPLLAEGDEYLLQPGDVLSVMFVGAMSLEQDVSVEMDGTAWFPIIGEMEIAGATLKEVRGQVAEAYSVTSFPMATSGESAPQFLQPNQVYVSVQEYRPVYVSGDLLQPRVIEYRPGLSLRQAIVLAGVGDVGEATTTVVRERVDAVVLALAQAYGRIWSLNTLLGTDTQQDYDNIFVARTEAIDEIVELERSLIQARNEERERLERTVATNILRAEMRLAALQRQMAIEEEGLQLDQKIVDDMRELASRGLTPSSRLGEVRRSALQSASRVLEIDTTIEQVRTELAELRSQAESVGAEGKSQAWSELGEAITRVHDLRAELATLRAAGAAPTLVGGDVVAVVTRQGEVLAPVDTGTTDLDLRPGDLVEIRQGVPRESPS